MRHRDGPGWAQGAEGLRPIQLTRRLAETTAARLTEVDRIPVDRKARLRELADFVRRRIAAGEPARLTFICTHNSRRSQMAQIWAQTAAAYFGIPRVETFSGGTEATAFDRRAAAALRRAGFQVDAVADDDNPLYEVRFDPAADPMKAFSKVYNQPPNPAGDFAAVMTCSQADEACPLVLGAAVRFAITYEDPKVFDGTGREAEAYDERCRQIGREMLYVFSVIEA